MSDTMNIHSNSLINDQWKTIPPWISFVERDDVPEEKSSRSTRPTRRPLVTASRATPLPVAPPPITRTSSGLAELAPIRADSWTFLGGTAAVGSAIFCRTAAMAEPPPPPRSLEENAGWLNRSAPPDVAAIAAAAAAPSRRRRVALAMRRRSDEIEREEREGGGRREREWGYGSLETALLWESDTGIREWMLWTAAYFCGDVGPILLFSIILFCKFLNFSSSGNYRITKLPNITRIRVNCLFNMRIDYRITI